MKQLLKEIEMKYENDTTLDAEFARVKRECKHNGLIYMMYIGNDGNRDHFRHLIFDPKNDKVYKIRLGITIGAGVIKKLRRLYSK